MAGLVANEYRRFEVTFVLDADRDVADIEKELHKLGGTEVEVVDEWEEDVG